MSVASFIPEVWSARLLTELDANHVFADVVNRDYEGEITKQGDTVHINLLSDPTIGTYVPNVTVIAPEQLDTDDQTLAIDQGKYFAFYVDDVDARQAAGDLLNTAAVRAAHGLRDVADKFLINLAVATNGGATPVNTGDLSDGDDAFSVFVQAMTALDEANVPSEGRWAVVPPAVRALLVGHNAFLDASASGSTDALLNGRVSRGLGFDIRVSTNVPEGTVITGHSSAITYAEQIVKVEAYRPESGFKDAVKGLHVYGGKVVRPEALYVFNA